MKWKATAMFYALMVVVLVGVMSSGMLFGHWMYVVENDAHTTQSRLLRNVESGMALGAVMPMDQGTSQALVDLFGLGADSVEVRAMQWGAYKVVASRAFCSGKQERACALVGGLPRDQRAGLHILDFGRALRMSGNARLTGTTYLPKRGAERGQVGHRRFQGRTLVAGSQRQSGSELPNKDAIVRTYFTRESVSQPTDSIVPVGEVLDAQLTRSFLAPLVEYTSNGDLLLDYAELDGHIVVRSPGKVVISNTCALRNIRIEAAEVEVQSGFEGTLHVVCTERATLQAGSALNYPSSIVLRGEHETFNAVSLEAEASIAGTVMAYAEDARKVGVVIAPSAQVIGEVWSAGWIENQGVVKGSATCNTLRLETPASVFENMLLDGQVLGDALPEDFACGMIEGRTHQWIQTLP